MNNLRRFARRGVAVTLIAASLSTQAPAQGTIFNQLAGPGEKVEFRALKPKDGGERYIRTTTNPDGSPAKFVGVGRVMLKSPKINLEADYLEFAADEGILRSNGNVIVEQPSVRATCQEMVYVLETGELTLSGDPDVKQETPENRTHFSGMETFILTQQETGEMEVRMEGGEEIICEVMPIDAPSTDTTTMMTPSATPTPTPTPLPTESRPADGNEAAGAVLPSGGGFAGLGENVKITTRPRQDQKAAVFVSTTEAGEFDLFRAQGSVVLESDQMDLRADILEYEGERQMVEALYNVYVRQQAIEADCGRMLYDIEEDEITLTVSPVVREKRKDAIMVISQMDSFIVKRNPDGSTSTQAIGGPEGEPSITWESLATPVPKQPKTPDDSPKEIDIDNPDDLQRLREGG